MDAKKLKGRYKRKIMMHMLFQIGGAVVILGALFKILHLEIGPITGGLVLGIGLGTEAAIFFIGGLMLDDVKEEHASYTEHLEEGHRPSSSNNEEEGLSSKIDAILHEAKLDVSLVNGLTESIRDLETSARTLAPATEVVSASNNYSEQLTKAASQIESLNELYHSQISFADSQNSHNDRVAENTQLLKEQMEALSGNLASLNKIYSGMLSAMNK